MEGGRLGDERERKTAFQASVVCEACFEEEGWGWEENFPMQKRPRERGGRCGGVWREVSWGRKVGGKGRDEKRLVGSCVPGQCYFWELRGPECGLGDAGPGGSFYFAERCCFGVERGEKVNPDFGWKFKKCYRGFDCYKVSVPTGMSRGLNWKS